VRYLYTFLLYLAMPFIFLRLFWRSRKLRDYRLRLGERLGFYPYKLEQSLWVHAVSVGETIAAVPLIKSLKAKYPDLPLLVTTMTPTGAARVKAAFGDTVHHAYLPYDMPGAINRFLQTMNPVACIIMETELWPNMLTACAKKNIPVCLTNARLSEKSAAGYGRIASLTKEMLEHVTRICACGQADAERFQALGAGDNQLSITGNLKFDLVLPDGLLEQALQLRNKLGSERFVWIAASTHEGEEEVILAAHQLLCEAHPDALLILVPRHPDRFDEIAELANADFNVSRRSSNDVIGKGTQVYLGDTMGEMLLMYGASDVAFVAGSLIPRGGHNILEPAALSKPIVTGEHLFNFTEICNKFFQAGALIKVTDADALASQLKSFLSDELGRQEQGKRAREVMDTNRGALARQLNVIESVISG
jgi:3-deoxy-D-manno-octulosonic-acid transferase